MPTEHRDHLVIEQLRDQPISRVPLPAWAAPAERQHGRAMDALDGARAAAAKILSDEDLTPEAKDRRVGAIKTDLAGKLAAIAGTLNGMQAEAEKLAGSIDAKLAPAESDRAEVAELRGLLRSIPSDVDRRAAVEEAIRTVDVKTLSAVASMPAWDSSIGPWLPTEPGSLRMRAQRALAKAVASDDLDALNRGSAALEEARRRLRLVQERAREDGVA